MHCPRCQHHHSRVLESRLADAGDAMRRRRQCLECAHRFTTYERIEIPTLWVTKHDGSSEAFDRDKLLRGLVHACRKRNVPTERLEALVIDIEQALRAQRETHISSDTIGALALEALVRVDLVAYVRFASVYRAFDGLDEFHAELARIAALAASGEGAAGRDTGGTDDRSTDTSESHDAPHMVLAARART